MDKYAWIGGRPGQCPVTEDVSHRLLRLPLFNNMDEVDVETVIQAIHRFPGASGR